MARNKVIQFQNGQEFDEFKVNGHVATTVLYTQQPELELDPSVTVQLFTADRLPVGYLILDPATASNLGLALTEAAVRAEGGLI